MFSKIDTDIGNILIIGILEKVLTVAPPSGADQSQQGSRTAGKLK